jgi:hypothetical protein
MPEYLDDNLEETTVRATGFLKAGPNDFNLIRVLSKKRYLLFLSIYGQKLEDQRQIIRQFSGSAFIASSIVQLVEINQSASPLSSVTPAVVCEVKTCFGVQVKS